MDCGADEYARILGAAVSFYVRMFVAKYERLPTPPVSLSLNLLDTPHSNFDSRCCVRRVPYKLCDATCQPSGPGCSIVMS